MGQVHSAAGGRCFSEQHSGEQKPCHGQEDVDSAGSAPIAKKVEEYYAEKGEPTNTM